MGPMAKSHKTAFYDLLEVKPNVTEQELKRAYRKRALKLHPDRGGDAEEFKRMKYAYDVLLDPKKRKAYDDYGEAAVKAMEGHMDPDLAMQIVLSIGFKERAVIVAIFCLVTGYLLLFPVLVCLKWDRWGALTFTQMFIPVWLTFLGILSCLWVLRVPTLDDEDDEETRTMIEELREATRHLKIVGSFVVLVLSMLLVFIIVKLDHGSNWSWFAVVWPWMLLEVCALVYKLWTASTTFVISGGDPAIVSEGGRKWINAGWNFHILSLMRPHFVHLILAYLVALKLDGAAISWWLVFSPVWLDWAFSVCSNCWNCTKIKSARDLEQMSDEERLDQHSCCSISCVFCIQAFALGYIGLLCMKLANVHAVSAFVIFLPLFCLGGCLCCCLSCGVCCMGPSVVVDEEMGVGTAAPASGPTTSFRTQAAQPAAYGSTAGCGKPFASA